VAIGASSDQLASLSRIVGGPELAKDRLLRLDSVDELNDPGQLAFLRRALCAPTGGTTRAWARRHTAKRALRPAGYAETEEESPSQIRQAGLTFEIGGLID
jgi:hypothetical protein